MGCYYEDNDAFEKQLDAALSSFGASKKTAMEELCRFRTSGADRYWSEQVPKPEMLPYIMMCRSDRISDYCAERFEDFIDRSIDGDDYLDMTNAAYFILHVCMNKESEAMLNACRKAAKNADKLRGLKISWEESDIITPPRQPDFLYARYLKERECGSEASFFGFLTDMLIITSVNAMDCDGKDETFSAKLRELFEDYPDVFTSAGFYAYFIKDTSMAYDRFEYLTADPLTYPEIMWVLDGLEYENGTYIQGSPTYFTGKDNDHCHKCFPIESLDRRWLYFLAKKPLSDIENSSVKDIYYARGFLGKFSTLLYHMINKNDAEELEIYRSYFRRSAVLAGNPADFAGLMECGGMEAQEDITLLGLDIAKKICEGRQTYCFRAMLHFCPPDYDLRLNAVKEIAAYLAAYEHSDELREQREDFFRQAELFNSGKPCAFTPEK